MKKLIYIFLAFALPLSAQDIGGDYYLAHPDSTYSGMNPASDLNDGSYLNPWATWQHALESLDKGDSLIIRGGRYMQTAGLEIHPYDAMPIGNDGAPDSVIYVLNYPGEYPIADFTNVSVPVQYLVGLDLNRVNYWHFEGFEITKVLQDKESTIQGVSTSGVSNLTFKNIDLNNIGGKGFSIYAAFKNPAYPEQAAFPSDTMRFINCDASYCMDSLGREPGRTDFGNWADGFWLNIQAKETYTIVSGCRSFMNSDDAFDMPASCQMRVEDNWAFDCGHLVDGQGKAFRMVTGDSTLTMSWEVVRNVSADNKNSSFIQGTNFDTYFYAAVYNNFSYNSGQDGYEVARSMLGTVRSGIYRNNISYQDTRFDVIVGSGSLITANSNNTWTSGSGTLATPLPDITPTVSLDSSDFVSLDVDELYTARQSDGSLPNINFGRPTEDSPVIDVGVADTLFTQLGLTYFGDFPDLGPFEYGAQTDVDSIHINTIGGVTTISVDDGQLQFYDTIWPIDATYQSVTWSVSNVTGQATIDQSGLVTATADGTVDVIGTAQDGTGVADTVRITISNQVNPIVPTVTTTIATGTFNVYSYCGGVVTSDGGGTVTARGVCWGTSLNPTLGTSNYTTEGTGTGAFSSFVSNLKPNTTYYIRAYATNSEGTAYGENRQTTTIPVKYKSVGSGSNVYYNGNKRIVQ